MAIEHLKRASRTPQTQSDAAREVAATMLADIEARGETAVCEYAEKLDRWTGEIIVAPAEIERRTRDIPASIKRDIEFATERVRRFAIAQRDSIREFATEIAPGLVAGQRLVPVNVAGCYVPTGRYAHIASAYMSVATAKAAGVPTVVACSTPYHGEAVHPQVLYAMQVAGADVGHARHVAQHDVRREPLIRNVVPVGQILARAFPLRLAVGAFLDDELPVLLAEFAFHVRPEIEIAAMGDSLQLAILARSEERERILDVRRADGVVR